MAPRNDSARLETRSASHSVVWFKRDLRVDDHAALSQAAAAGLVVGLYVYEPDVLEAAEHDPAHLVFVNECLQELRAELRRRGSELLIRRGSIPQVLEELRTELPFDTLWSHEECGLAATYARDRRVAKWCRGASVRWIERPQHGVVRPLRQRDGWAKIWHERMSATIFESPAWLTPPSTLSRIAPGEICGTNELGLPESEMTEAQRGGASEGIATLRSFLDDRGIEYQGDMSSPVEGWTSCSRLSPHLAYGSISLRRVYQACRDRRRALTPQERRTNWSKSLHSFEKRLRWHCHFTQKLEDEPEIEFRNFNRAYDGLRQEDSTEWSDRERQFFEAWCEGRTGYPLVDACMRILRRTGWVNFRMRAMLMSFASYHLWLHWRPTGQFLARRFLDFEPGIHYSQCQMQSGVTGINALRIYSPIKQVVDQDPEGVFIRRWVPELESVPSEHLPQPEKMTPMEQRMASVEIGVDYPAPIVDHATAYREARQRMFSVRRSPESRSEAQRVYQRHGSRRRPSPRRKSTRSAPR